MPDLRISLVGTVEDVHGEEVEIGVVHDAAPGPDDDPEAVISIGDGIELGPEETGELARLLVSACWQAGRQVPGG